MARVWNRSRRPNKNAESTQSDSGNRRCTRTTKARADKRCGLSVWTRTIDKARSRPRRQFAPQPQTSNTGKTRRPCYLSYTLKYIYLSYTLKYICLPYTLKYIYWRPTKVNTPEDGIRYVSETPESHNQHVSALICLIV